MWKEAVMHRNNQNTDTVKLIHAYYEILIRCPGLWRPVVW